MSEPLAKLDVPVILDTTKVDAGLAKLKKTLADLETSKARAEWRQGWIRRAESVHDAARSMVKSLGSVGVAAKSAGGSITSALKLGLGVGLGIQAVKGLASAITAPFRGLGQAILDSSEIEVIERKFKNVFEDMADDAGEFAKQYAAKIGQSQATIKSVMARLQDTFVPMGFDRKSAAGLTKNMTGLATDLAANEGISIDESMQRVISGISGNHEALRLFGVVLTEASLKAKLFEMGVEGGTEAATEQQKVLARMAILVEKTRDAHGMAGNAAGTFASEMSGLNGMLFEVSAAIGDVFKPAATAILRFFRESLVEVKKNIEVFKEWGAKVGETVSRVASEAAKWVKFALSGSAGFMKTMEMIGNAVNASIEVAIAYVERESMKVVAAIGGAVGGMLGVSGDEIRSIFREIGNYVADMLDAFHDMVGFARLIKMAAMGNWNPMLAKDIAEFMSGRKPGQNLRDNIANNAKNGGKLDPKTMFERMWEGAQSGIDGIDDSKMTDRLKNALNELRRIYDQAKADRDKALGGGAAGEQNRTPDYMQAINELNSIIGGGPAASKGFSRVQFGGIAEMQKDLQSKLGGEDQKQMKRDKNQEDQLNAQKDIVKNTKEAPREMADKLKDTLNEMINRLGTLG